uniref:Uncharacterized protein n=1 Tax=Aureoumbra lagunensis TaxID=44058 RepID=A0A7S3K343_9STRA
MPSFASKAEVEQTASIFDEFQFCEPQSKHVILDIEAYKRNQRRQNEFTKKVLLSQPTKTSSENETVFHKGDLEPLQFENKINIPKIEVTKEEKAIRMTEAKLRTGQAFLEARQSRAALATFAKALQELKQITAMPSLEAQLHIGLSNAALRLANPQRAESEAQMALSLSSDDNTIEEAHLARGLARLALQRNDEAKDDLLHVSVAKKTSSSQSNPLLLKVLELLSSPNHSSY